MNISNQIKILIRQSHWASGLFIILMWLFVWELGRLMEYTEHASVWFPPAGFTFSCLLVLGKRALLPILFTTVLVTLWQINHYQIEMSFQKQILSGGLFGVAHIFPYWIGARIVSVLSNKEDIGVPKLIVSFLLIAALSTLITASLVISSLVYTDQLQLSEFSKTILPFWIGDMAGVVVLGPLLTAVLINVYAQSNANLSRFWKSGWNLSRGFVFKVALNLVFIIISMLLAYWFQTEESAFAIYFLTVTHMWIASTESPLANVLSLAISSFFIVVLVHFFALMDLVMIYQLALNVIGANALFGMAIPQLRAANKELTFKVNTDELTKVATRHHFLIQVEKAISNSALEQSKLSLAIFDVDNFKLINDSFGHSKGDEALKEVCLVSKRHLTSNQLLARFGGDEFVILFPNSDLHESKKVVEMIRHSISNITIGESAITSSFGMAELAPGGSFRELFQKADQALYDSKKSGGNQVSLSI